MDPLHAIALGVVEGLTEFLPVSSTGHLILLSEWLGQTDEVSKSIDIVIQLGAILAVVWYFRARLGALVRGLWRREAESTQLALALTAAFLPTAAAGLLVHRWVKAHLFGSAPVAGALVVGGVAMIAVERWRARRGVAGREGLEQISVRAGLWVGLAQCLSLWPGASRSMTTIVGGQLAGLSTRTAAEFSFLLAIPTLGAATLYDLAKSYQSIVEAPGALGALGIGLVVSFAVALAVVALFLRYLNRWGLTPFGLYRILLGVAVLLWT